MPKFEIQTEINAPIEICFDHASSIDLHQVSTHKTKEKAFAGTSGLIGIGRIFNRLVLTNYMKNFLTDRNQVIKEYAESREWKQILAGYM